jgi:hypothetical protein
MLDDTCNRFEKGPGILKLGGKTMKSATSQAVASIDPFNALMLACHVSDRVFSGTIYTIADSRFPEINGRRVIKTLEAGRDVFAWYGEVK